ncbi:MAG: flagellin, partial [Synergistaceae bacterium]|nr:flagellin [Synergistaceae bacterium]
MRIANNLPALDAYASLNNTNTSLQKSIQRLSTGLTINQASDDAAGFAISEKMRSQISGLDTARRNTQDGVSLLQTAEGALGETNSMLQRMRELAVQAANDSLTSNDRQYLQLEIDKLQEQIDRIADTTQFNKKRLLNGSSGALWSSYDLKLKAKINGGLTYVDNFGQKVSAEGNYKIQIVAEGGRAQVQKSNIMTMTQYTTQTVTVSTPITETQTVTKERTHIIELSTGLDNSETPASSGDGWEFAT